MTLRHDVLRALADAGADGETASAASVAGRLDCLVEEAAFAIADLVGEGLAEWAGTNPDGLAVWELTEAGRAHPDAHG